MGFFSQSIFIDKSVETFNLLLPIEIGNGLFDFTHSFPRVLYKKKRFKGFLWLCGNRSRLVRDLILIEDTLDLTEVTSTKQVEMVEDMVELIQGKSPLETLLQGKGFFVSTVKIR